MNEHLKSITISIDSRLECVCLVGLAMRGICAGLYLSQDSVLSIELATCEAVNNSIEHGYANQPGHQVQIKMHVGADLLTVQVLDTGKGFDPTSIKESQRVLSTNDCSLVPERGRGLSIIASIMDS